MAHDKRCTNAKGKVCKCDCGGALHGTGQKDINDNNWFDIILTEKEAREFKIQFNKRNECRCGYKGLHNLPIYGYKPHPGGWTVRGEKHWLFIHCPDCEYDWSIWKLGTFRESKQYDITHYWDKWEL